MRSGLLSLNVHDSLTYEGSELCLHPDLFLVQQPQPQQHYGGGASTTSTSSLPSQHAKPASEVLLSVGDMVEIRVWDHQQPQPGEHHHHQQHSGGSSIISPRKSSTSGAAGNSGSNSPNTAAKSVFRKSSISANSNVIRSTSSSSNMILPTITTTPSGSGVEVEFPLQPTMIPPQTTNSSVSSATTTLLRPRTTSMASHHSLQYSEASAAGAGSPTTVSMAAAASSASSVSESIGKKNDETSVASGSHSTEGNNNSITTPAMMGGLPPTPPSAKASRTGGPFQNIPLPTTPSGSTIITTTVEGAATPPPPPTPPPSQPPSSSSKLLPPVFPRPRTHTTDQPSVLLKGSSLLSNNNTSTIGNKPSMIHRRAVSAAAAAASSSSYNASGPSTMTVVGGGPPPRSPKLFTRHTRDISDMTTDTHSNPLLVDDDDMALLNDSHRPSSMIMGTSQDDDTAAGAATGGVVVGDDEWSKISMTHKLRLSFVVLVTESTLTSLQGKNARTQISLLRPVADLYALSTYDTVTVHKVGGRGPDNNKEDDEDDETEKETVLKTISADFVVVMIKDQFISRGDMLLFQQRLLGKWIYEGQRLSDSSRGIKAHAREIRHGNFAAKSGVVTADTMITFRSRSARIIWLIQLSSEMWDYASPYDHRTTSTSTASSTTKRSEPICEIYFDQWIRFVYKLFRKWKEMEVSHALTIVFFSRTFVLKGKSKLNCVDAYGRYYEDHYKTIIENETRADWESLVVQIKREFIKHPIEVGWNVKNRRPSTASQGNVLEAINVTLNVMQYHYLDRDLRRTGNSIVVVSPGCGVFEVDKGLAGITYQRMMDHGIGSDMLSLGLPPLHVAPFFLYNNEVRKVEEHGVDSNEMYYEVPHWMHLSFISYDKDDDNDGELTAKNTAAATNETSLQPERLEVGSNGFLGINQSKCSNTKNHPSPSNGSIFPGFGHGATQGKAKTHQERQLISGRNFRDILEACRPRPAGGGMPSPLVALLTAHHAATGEPSHVRKVQPNVSGRRFLQEWGTVDFTESPVMRRSKLRQSVSPIAHTMPLDNLEEKGEDQDSVSTNSSFPSYVSSVFGTTPTEKTMDFTTHLESMTTFGAIQIQRSPSLEFDQPMTPTRSSHNKDHPFDFNVATGPAFETDNSLMRTYNATEKRDSQSDLRALMKAHDQQACASRGLTGTLAQANNGTSKPYLVEPQATIVTVADSSVFPKTSPAGKTKDRIGSLGAALTSGDSVHQEQWANPMQQEQWAMGQSSNMLTRTLSETIHSQHHHPGKRTNDATPYESRPSPGTSNMFVSGVSPPIHHSAHGLRTRMRPGEMKSSRRKDSRPGPGPQLSLLSCSNYELGTTTRPNHTPGARVTHEREENVRQQMRPFSRSPPTVSRGTLKGDMNILTPRPLEARAIGKLSARPLGSKGMIGAKRMIGTKPKHSPGRRDEHHGHNTISRRKKACNPFRQSDEDEVLAQRSHNRRRWSHVFPVGEAEFKRQSGPLWNSLCAPAILPLSVDYFPSPTDLRGKFQFNPYTVTLGGMDKKLYATHRELMEEMVRQRVSQDFQLVTATAIDESKKRTDSQRGAGRNASLGLKGIGSPGNAVVSSRGDNRQDVPGTLRRHLSMGHRIQTLTYDPGTDSIEVVHYTNNTAQNDKLNIYSYQFLLFSEANQGFTQCIQTFKKYYSEPYKWNQVDNLVCGEQERTLEVGMRFRRLMFGIIPPCFDSKEAELDYVQKFQRLVEYIEKLRVEEPDQPSLGIKIVSTSDSSTDLDDVKSQLTRGTTDDMITFNVRLRKTKQDSFEWLELAVDPVFRTSSSFRIMFNWLVASTDKVDTQIQMLQRRCTQFGLVLIGFPQTTVARDVFVHAFLVPTIVCITDKSRADRLDVFLRDHDFLDDGTQMTDAQFLSCVETSEDYDFPRSQFGESRKTKPILARQYVHRSGELFVRVLRDRQGWAVLAGIENTRIAPDERKQAKMILQTIMESDIVTGDRPKTN